MNRTIEILAMALGGISLLTVCFLGFALASGTPLHEVGVIGKLFQAPELPEAPTEDTAVAGAAGDPAPNSRALSDEKVIMSQAGLLHAWQFPSPFDAEELADLTESLKMRRHELDLREADLDRRDARLNDEEKAIEDRIEGLVALQGRMDKQRVELEALRTQLEERQREETLREQSKWASQARLLESMKSSQRNGILASGSYEPEEMAQILKAMSESARAEVMNGLQESIKDPALLRSYLEAYGRIAADGE